MRIHEQAYPSPVEGVHLQRRTSRMDKRYKLLVVMDGDQILQEYWPISDENKIRAHEFAIGYQFAKTVHGID